MKKITTHCLESQNLSVPFYSAKHLSLHGLEAHSFTNRITPIWKEVPLWGSTFPWHTPKYNQDIQYSHTKSSEQSSRYYHQSRTPSGFSNHRFSVCFFVWKTLPREAWKTGRLPHTGKRSKQEKKQPTTVAGTAPSKHWGTEEHDAALSWRFQDLCMALCYVNNNMAT